MGDCKAAKTVYHIFILMILIPTFVFEMKLFPSSFLHSLVYISQISFYLNIIYFTLSLIGDFGLFNCKKCMDTFFNINFIICFTITALYWGMFLYDKSMLFSRGYSINYTIAYILHGGTLLYCLLEQIIFNIRRHQRYLSLSWIFFMPIVYLSTLKVLNYFWGISSYPFLLWSWWNYFFAIIGGIVLLMIGELFYIYLTKFQWCCETTEEETREGDYELLPQV